MLDATAGVAKILFENNAAPATANDPFFKKLLLDDVLILFCFVMEMVVYNRFLNVMNKHFK